MRSAAADRVGETVKSCLVPATLLVGLYGAAAIIAVARTGFDPALLAASLMLVGLLVALSLIDYATFRLPDPLTASVGLLGLAVTMHLDSAALAARLLAVAAGFLSLAAVGLIYQQLTGRAGLGLGDAKLLGAAGAWVGLEALPTVVLAASLSALALLVLRLAYAGALERRMRIAFGPYLAFATWVVWLHGPLA